MKEYYKNIISGAVIIFISWFSYTFYYVSLNVHLISSQIGEMREDMKELKSRVHSLERAK